MIQHIRIFLLQQYDERIERLSQQDNLSNFLYGCTIFELLRMDSIS